MVNTTPKSATAFRTIGEVSDQFGIQRHILRYWETRFPQLRPLQRAGNRRYYRVEDVALIERINHLLNREGYTVKGVQALLATANVPSAGEAAALVAQITAPPSSILPALRAIRDRLARALAQDDIAARIS